LVQNTLFQRKIPQLGLAAPAPNSAGGKVGPSTIGSVADDYRSAIIG
jgi:hypothetical protein